MRILVPVLCKDQTYIGQRIALLSTDDFMLQSADIFNFLNFAMTQLMWSLFPRQLSQRQARLNVNWVNAGRRYLWIFHVDVDVESQSALTQSNGVSLSVDSIEEDSDSSSTQWAEDELS